MINFDFCDIQDHLRTLEIFCRHHHSQFYECRTNTSSLIPWYNQNKFHKKEIKITNNFIKSNFLHENDCQQLDELKKLFENEVETNVNKTTM